MYVPEARTKDKGANIYFSLRRGWRLFSKKKGCANYSFREKKGRYFIRENFPKTRPRHPVNFDRSLPDLYLITTFFRSFEGPVLIDRVPRPGFGKVFKQGFYFFLIKIYKLNTGPEF